MNKKLLFSILFLALHSNAFCQLKEYFIPSNKYHKNQPFLFESEELETENGIFTVKHKVQYSKDPTGNYKKYTERISYRYNVPEFSIKKHSFYNIQTDRVTNIYSYVEEVSDLLKERGFIDNYERNSVVIKFPPAKWIDKSEQEINKYYDCSFGSVKTKYGHYNDCIIVTNKNRGLTDEFKFVEEGYTKEYYAKNLGLVKEEYLDPGTNQPIKEFANLERTLVDNFSEYSFAQIEKKEEEEKRFDEFLAERQKKVFNYKVLEPHQYNFLSNSIENKLKTILGDNFHKTQNLDFDIDFHFQTELDGSSFQDIQFHRLNELDLQKAILEALTSIKVSPAYSKNYSNYTVKTSGEIPVNISIKNISYGFTFDGEEKIKAKEEGMNFKNDKEQILIYLQENNYPAGIYIVSLNKTRINKEEFRNFQVKDYKSFGGAGFALLSAVVPGAGDHFVNGGQGSFLGKRISPWVTTVGTLGFIGLGSYYKYQSIANYNTYHSATEQAEIDKYYDLANEQNKSAITYLGLGGMIWIADIVWVAAKGVKNRKEGANFRKDRKITYYPTSLGSNVALSINIKF